MKRLLIIIVLLSVFLPANTNAMDPVTIAILAPVAIEGAKTASPYIIRGMVSGGKHMVQMAGHIAEIFLIPWGCGQILLMDYSSGAGNIFQGLCAPFKLIGDVLLLPIAFCGIDISS